MQTGAEHGRLGGEGEGGVEGGGGQKGVGRGAGGGRRGGIPGPETETPSRIIIILSLIHI